MMIGTSALIASTAFFINTISPVQAIEKKEVSFNSELSNKTEGAGIPEGTIVGCGTGIYKYVAERSVMAFEKEPAYWKKVGP